MAWAAVRAVDLVGNDEPYHTRPARVRVGLNIGQAGQRLDDRIVYTLADIWALFAKAADRDIDKVGFHLAQDVPHQSPYARLYRAGNSGQTHRRRRRDL